MELFSHVLPANANLFLAGDDHDGALARYEKGVLQMIAMLQEPYDNVPAKNNRLLHHGDPAEFILIDDPRYDAMTTKEDSVFAQIDNVIATYWPVRNKMICMLDGNHAFKMHRLSPKEPLVKREITNKLGIPYGGWTAKITYTDAKGNLLFKHLATHGPIGRSIRSAADSIKRRELNKILSLQRILCELAGDTLLMSMGHTHQLIHTEPTSRLYMKDDGVEIRSAHTKPDPHAEYIPIDERYYVNTGSFLKTQLIGATTYSERAGYPPNELGFYIAFVRDYKLVGVKRVPLV